MITSFWKATIGFVVVLLALAPKPGVQVATGGVSFSMEAPGLLEDDGDGYSLLPSDDAGIAADGDTARSVAPALLDEITKAIDYTITIDTIEYPAGPGFPTDYTVSEGYGPVTVWVYVTASVVSGSSVTIPISVSGSGTASAVDFSDVADFNVTVPAWVLNGKSSFTLTPTDDSVDETKETVTVSSTHASVTNSPSIALSDNDATPTVSLSVSDSSVDEDDGATTITVTGTVGGTTTFGTGQTLAINVSGSGTASAVDFSPVSDFDLTIDAEKTSGTATFTLTPTNDSVDETDETVTVGSTSSLVSSEATISLKDDDATPSVSLSVSDSSIDEDEGETTITVTGTVGGTTTFGADQTLPITVTGSGTASAVDFSPVSNFNLVIDAEESTSTATFKLTPTDDTVDETDETVTVGSTSSLVSGSVTISLKDDDATPTSVALSLSDTSVDEDDGATTITVTGTVGGSTTFGTDQTLSITVTGSGTASAVDFSPVSNFNLTIDAEGSTGTATFTLTPTDDSVDETDETVTVGSTSSLVSSSVTISLEDDDATPTSISLSVSDSSVDEDDGATSITVTGTVGGSTTFGTDQTLAITVTGSGTASAVDFSPVSDFSLTIEAEDSTGTATFTLTPTDDSVDETDETLMVGSSSVLVSTPVPISLKDDDATPTSISLSVSDSSVEEDDGATSITVTATVGGSTTFGTDQTLAITVTGSGTASAVDFSPVSNFNLTIDAEETTGTASFTLTPRDDSVDETDETISVGSTSTMVSASASISLVDDDATPTGVTLSVSDTSVDEDDGATSITVTGTVGGSTTFGTDQTLAITVTGSGTASAVDFSPVSNFNLTIDAEKTTGTATFTLTPTDDTVDETDESVRVGSTSSLVSGAATISLNDDDATPASVALSLSTTSIDEDDGATSVTVTATVGGSTTFGTDKTLAITVTGSGTASAVDFSPVSNFNLTIDAEKTTGTASFTLTPTDDAVDETNETVSVGSTSSLVSTSQTITLVDDDTAPGKVGLSVSTMSIDEDDGATQVTVTGTVGGSTTFATDKSVTIAITGTGTASAVDFSPVSDFTLTIAAAASSGTATFTLTPTDDVVDETNETVTVSSTSSLVSGSATISLIDDDATPTSVALSLSPTSIDEDDGATSVTVTATVGGSTTFGTDQTLPITVSASGTATAVDFSPVSNFNLTIDAGDSTGKATFTLTPTDDSVDETNETVTVASTSNLVSASPTVTLVDDDTAPGKVGLSVSTTSIDEDDGATQVTVTGTVGGSTTFAADKSVTIAVSGSGTASAVDFSPVSDFTLTIGAGTSSGTATFTLTPTDDKVDESNETVSVSSANSLVSGSATISLIDDDATPTSVVLSLSTTSIDEDDGATSVTVTATVGGPTTFGTDQTLPITVSGSGTVEAVDFAPVSNFNLTIDAEDSTGTATFTLTPTDDLVDEADETVTVGSASKLVSAMPTITLVDDDATPTSVTLSLSVVTLGEGDGTTTVTVTATVEGPTTFGTDQTFPISVSGSGPAWAVDFAPVSDFNLTVAAEAKTGTATFTLTPTDDVVDETNETIKVSSTSSLVSGAATGAPGFRSALGSPVSVLAADITLFDNDATPDIALALNPTSVMEGDGTTVITVTGSLVGTTVFGAPQIVPLTVTGTGREEVVDFTPVPGFNLVIDAEASAGTATFSLEPNSDTVDEVEETITVASTSAQVTNAPTITLWDDDSAPASVTLAASPVSIGEEDGATMVTVTATLVDGNSFGTPQKLPISIHGSGNRTAVDFQPVPDFDLTIPANATTGTGTFTLTPIGDTVIETDEVVTVTSHGSMIVSPAVVAILDDESGSGIDHGTLRLQASPASISEGDGATTVTVQGTVTGPVPYSRALTVPIAVSGSGTHGAVAFGAVPDFSLTVPPDSWSGTATFTISPVENQVANSDEVVTVNSVSAVVTNESTLTLADNDAVAGGIVLTADPATVNESGGPVTVTVTATLDGTSTFASAQTLPIAVSGSGTSDAVGFNAVPDFTLTIAAGAAFGTATFTLTPIDDSFARSNETVTVTSSNTLVTNPATITLVDDEAAATSVTLSVAPTSIGEGDGATAVAVTATLVGTAVYSGALVLPIAVAGSGAADVVGFTAASDLGVTIAAGASSGTAVFTLTPVDDAVVTADETVTVRSTIAVTANTAAITLSDNDSNAATVTLSVKPTIVYEDGGATEVTVTATVAPSATFDDVVTLPIRASGSAATDVVAFKPVPDFDLAIAAGASSGTATFTVTPEDNAAIESNETISVSSEDPRVGSAATVVLVDDDGAGQLVLSADPNMTSESDGTKVVTVTATLTGDYRYPVDLSVPISVTGSGVQTAVKFQAVPEFNLMLAAGASSGSASFDLIPIDDQIQGTDETLTISSSDPLVTTFAELTLMEDDLEPGAIVLEADPSTIREDSGPTMVTVTARILDETRFATDHVLMLSVAGGSPDDGTGFDPVPDFMLTIPAAASNGSATFELVPKDDNVHNPDVEVTVSSQSSLVENSAFILLQDDDAPPTGIALSAAPASLSEGAGATAITIEATVQGGTTFGAAQRLSISASGSGLEEAVDFAAIPDFELVVPAASETASVTVDVTPEDDQVDEPDEVITFIGNSPLVTESATLTLTDDDAAPSGMSIAVSPATIAEDAGATEVSITVRVDGGTRYATRQTLPVSLAGTGMPEAVGFAPIAPFDVVIEAGDDAATATFTVTPEDDLLDEVDETVTVTAVHGGTELKAQLSIADDDAAPAGIALSVAPELVSEGDGETTITVTASVQGATRYAARQPLSVTVSDPVPGAVEYEAIPAFSIAVPAGADAATGTFTLTPKDNRLADADATISVRALHAGTTLTETITLLDDDVVNARVKEVNLVVVPEMARAFAASTVGAVSERLAAVQNGQRSAAGSISQALSRVTSGIRQEAANVGTSAQGRRSWGEHLSGTRLATSIGRRLTLWGLADYRAISGNSSEHPVDFDGGVTGIHAGLDVAFGRGLLVGVAASQLEGDLDYSYQGGRNQRVPGGKLDGAYMSGNRSINPYLHWSWAAGSGLWAMVSLGAGDATLADQELEEESTDTHMRTAAIGGTHRLHESAGGLSLDLKGAAWDARMELEDNNSEITALDIAVHRIQLSIEGRYKLSFSGGGSLAPFVEAGVRSDGGDGETGLGIEMGGGARLAVPSIGLSIAGRGRTLLAHQGSVEEWGFGGELSFTPGGDRGLSVEMGSSSGQMLGGIQRIWAKSLQPRARQTGGNGVRMHSNVGYSFVLGPGTMKPYSGVEVWNGVNPTVGAEYRMGSRLSLRIEAAQRMQRGTRGQLPQLQATVVLR